MHSLFEARSAHQVPTKDPALGIVVDEFYWNIYAQGLRMDLSNGMEMGGLSQPTPADLLYRLIPALQTLATIRLEQLDNRFRLGVAYRWNNDQIPSGLKPSKPWSKTFPRQPQNAQSRGLAPARLVSHQQGVLGIVSCMTRKPREPTPTPKPHWRKPSFPG